MTLHGQDRWGAKPRDPLLQCDACGSEYRYRTGEIETTYEGETRDGTPILKQECSACIEARERIETRATNNHAVSEYSQ